MVHSVCPWMIDWSCCFYDSMWGGSTLWQAVSGDVMWLLILGWVWLLLSWIKVTMIKLVLPLLLNCMGDSVLQILLEVINYEVGIMVDTVIINHILLWIVPTHFFQMNSINLVQKLNAWFKSTHWLRRWVWSLKDG